MRYLMILLIAFGALAQQPQRRMVRIGGGDDGERTKDWPKVAASTDPAAAIDKLASELSSRDLYSGTLLVAKDGKPMLVKSYGKGNTDDTKYNLGSINKVFTHVALM